MTDETFRDLAGWYARLVSGDATDDDRRSFQAWLNAAPANRRALEHFNQILGLVDELWTDSRTPADFLDLEPKQQPNVLEPRVPAAAPSPPHCNSPDARPQRQVRRRAWGMAASLLLCLGVIAMLYRSFPATPVYTVTSTAIGERRTVHLADGSRATLNTDTELDYALSQLRRHVRLARGEAYFEVAKNAAAPFIVSVGGRDVRAIGTAFDIRHVDDHTLVTVTEGVVEVFEPGSPASERSRVRLTADMAASYAAHSEIEILHGISPHVADAWLRGQLIYRNQTLRQVIDDLNRYFPRKMLLIGNAADTLRLSAVINLTDQDAMLNTLSRQLPIQVTYRTDGTLVVTAAHE